MTRSRLPAVRSARNTRTSRSVGGTPTVSKYTRRRNVGVADDRRKRDGLGLQTAPPARARRGDPRLDRGNLRRLQRIAIGRHPLFVIVMLEPRDEFAGGGFARHDGGRARLAALQRGGAGIQFQTALFFFAMAAETLLAQDRQHGRGETSALRPRESSRIPRRRDRSSASGNASIGWAGFPACKDEVGKAPAAA
jgi:hypothetical protein